MLAGKLFGISDLTTEALEIQWTQKLPVQLVSQQLINKGKVQKLYTIQKKSTQKRAPKHFFSVAKLAEAGSEM